jgi:leucyl-tRNA synthetase
VVPADIAKSESGADAVRMYICFMGPFEKDKPWSMTGIDGVRRFLDRTWRLVCDDAGNLVANDEAVPASIEKLLHKTIKKITEDIEVLSFNTSISQMMILVNELYKQNVKPKKVLKTLAQLMMPFAPHIAEELWEKLGGEGFVSLAPWPSYDPALTVDDMVTLGVQVNGKMRGTVDLSVNAEEAEAVIEALKVTTIQQALSGKNPDKIIYKAGRILNLIVK